MRRQGTGTWTSCAGRRRAGPGCRRADLSSARLPWAAPFATRTGCQTHSLADRWPYCRESGGQLIEGVVLSPQRAAPGADGSGQANRRGPPPPKRFRKLSRRRRLRCLIPAVGMDPARAPPEAFLPPTAGRSAGSRVRAHPNNSGGFCSGVFRAACRPRSAVLRSPGGRQGGVPPSREGAAGQAGGDDARGKPVPAQLRRTRQSALTTAGVRDRGGSAACRLAWCQGCGDSPKVSPISFSRARIWIGLGSVPCAPR